MSFLYNPGKANIVVDSLNSMTEEGKEYVVRYSHRLARFCVLLEDSLKGGSTVYYNSASCLLVKVKSK